MEEGPIAFLHLVGRNKGTTAVTVASPQNHPLVKEFLEGLFGRYNTDVIEELVPEASVEQVKDCVLGTTDVDVHWQPSLEKLFVCQFLIIVRVNIAQVVPARTRPLWHGVGLTATFYAVFPHHFQPVCQVSKR